MTYDLHNLTEVYPTYRRFFGISSARLELCFGLRRLVLRGIGDTEAARQIVSHLLPYCSETPDSESPSRHLRAHGSQTKKMARAQARAWERTNKLPAFTPSSEEASTHWKAAFADEADLFADDDLLAIEPSEIVHKPSTPPVLADSETIKTAQCAGPDPEDLPVELAAPGGESQQASRALAVREISQTMCTVRPQALHVPRIQPPLHSVHLVNPDQKLPDICSVRVPAFKASVLPVIHVPVRLEPGECAHYSIGATLCGDRLASSHPSTYPPLDHGLLILTNRRIFFIGEHSRLSVPYLYLWYVSLLQDAIALHLEGQFRRIIIEVEHSAEWASRIEQIAFVARRTPVSSGGSALSNQLLPGLKSSPGELITLKRGAIKFPNSPKSAISLEARAASLHEDEAQKIVEARTVEFDNQNEDTAIRPAQIASGVIEAETVELAVSGLVEAETIELDVSELVEAETIELFRQIIPEEPEPETLELTGQRSNRPEESETIILSRKRSTEAGEGTQKISAYQRRRNGIARAMTRPVTSSARALDEQTKPRRITRAGTSGRAFPQKKRGHPEDEHPAS